MGPGYGYIMLRHIGSELGSVQNSVHACWLTEEPAFLKGSNTRNRMWVPGQHWGGQPTPPNPPKGHQELGSDQISVNRNSLLLWDKTIYRHG